MWQSEAPLWPWGPGEQRAQGQESLEEQKGLLSHVSSLGTKLSGGGRALGLRPWLESNLVAIPLETTYSTQVRE